MDHEVDLLIVGSGFAGLAAAIEARGQGTNVLVVEKMKTSGGNSVISDGGIAAPGTELQQRQGVQDSPQQMYQDMITAGLGLNHPDLVRTVVENAKEVFEWSRKELGVPYMDRVDIFGGHSVPRCYTPEGVTGLTMIKKMRDKLTALDIPVWYSSALNRLLTDQDNSVRGAEVLLDYDYKTGQGRIHRIRTRQGVILATGGYGADVPFRSIQDPRLDDSIQTTNKPFATAEALKSALAIGAASVQLSQIQLGGWASPDEKGFGHGPLFADYILFQYGIILDPATGNRFVNELGDRKVSADAILAKGHPCVGIADAEAVKKSGWDISKAIKKGVVRTFETLKDMAAYYQIEEAPLTESLHRYNAFVEKGVDQDFGKPIVVSATPIAVPPYYAMRLWPKVHFTMGGLHINNKAQVLDFEGHPIRGLYAAGEVAGGVHGASRLGSCAITECLVFGRIAGGWQGEEP